MAIPLEELAAVALEGSVSTYVTLPESALAKAETRAARPTPDQHGRFVRRATNGSRPA